MITKRIHEVLSRQTDSEKIGYGLLGAALIVALCGGEPKYVFGAYALLAIFGWLGLKVCTLEFPGQAMGQQ